MLFQPASLLQSPGLIAATMAVILIAKPLVSFAVLLAFGYRMRTAVSVGITSAQIGEFSFLLATTATQLGFFDSRVTNTIVAAGIISITLNPLYYRLVDPLERMARQILRTDEASAVSDASEIRADREADQAG
jgi:CPA2 family monovalent cation:H+ antiporter-2